MFSTDCRVSSQCKFLWQCVRPNVCQKNTGTLCAKRCACGNLGGVTELITSQKFSETAAFGAKENNSGSLRGITKLIAYSEILETVCLPENRAYGSVRSLANFITC